MVIISLVGPTRSQMCVGFRFGRLFILLLNVEVHHARVGFGKHFSVVGCTKVPVKTTVCLLQHFEVNFEFVRCLLQ